LILAFFTVVFYGHAMKQGQIVKRGTWEKTKVQNLVRHKSGRYYARIYAAGKETWRALKTDIMEVAKAKLRTMAPGIERTTRAAAAQERGRMTLGDCAAILRERLKSGTSMPGRGKTIKRLRPNSVIYRGKCIDSIFRTRPAWETTDVRKLSPEEIEKWSNEFAAKYSASVHNNVLGTLRFLLQIARNAGSIHDDPSEGAPKSSIPKSTLRLPERAQFIAFVESIRTAGAWCSRDCADLVQFIAYTGARKNEAAHILWADVDFNRNRLFIREGKGGHARHVPLIRAAQELIGRMREERLDEPLESPVLRVHEAQKAMDAAARKVGMERITHHDLRHLFATTCIESGIDIPTVSRWLGHQDGGALAMKTYGHLRDDHSIAQAQKVTFNPL
jgi:integrase